MNVALEAVEGEIAHLWEEEARRSQAARVELMTVVALVSDAALRERAERSLAAVVAAHPARTILAVAGPGDVPAITAQVSLHRQGANGPPRGDAVVLEATGGGREWLPENIDRLALSDLPVCLWWVGDLPDFDHLFDRLLCCADVVVVNSCDMDLRDIERLSEIALRAKGRFALSDLTWIRLRPLQELIARFFDDEGARAYLAELARIRIVFVPRKGDRDATSTQAGLLMGWMAHALGLGTHGAVWRRGESWSEATLGSVVVRFEEGGRSDVPTGTLLSVSLECRSATFSVERQDDAQVFRWSREIPGAPTPSQTLRIAIPEDGALLVNCLSRPKQDHLLERSLHAASAALRPVAPQLSPPR